MTRRLRRAKGRECAICTHVERGQIEQWLVAGISARQIALRVGDVSSPAVSRHLYHHRFLEESDEKAS